MGQAFARDDHARATRGKPPWALPEAWRALTVQGVGEWLQASFNLSRRDGVQNIVVMHRLSDLAAAGAAGSRERELAEGLLHDASTRVIYRQVSDNVPRTREVPGLSSVEAQLLPEFDDGVGAVEGRLAQLPRPARPRHHAPHPQRHR